MPFITPDIAPALALGHPAAFKKITASLIEENFSDEDRFEMNIYIEKRKANIRIYWGAPYISYIEYIQDDF